jgi:hypothetical protein
MEKASGKGKWKRYGITPAIVEAIRELTEGPFPRIHHRTLPARDHRKYKLSLLPLVAPTKVDVAT